MPLYKIMPPPSQRMGMLWTLAGVKDIAVIDYGPEGTLAYFYHSLAYLGASPFARMYTISTKEEEIIFGKTERLRLAIKRIAKQYAPKVIFVSQSPVSEIIGDDIEALCAKVELEIDSKVVCLPNGGITLGSDRGVELSLELLVKTLCKEPTRPIDKVSYNIIGSCFDDFNFQADTGEIKRMMKSYFGFDACCVLSSDCCSESIQKMTRAQLNIVTRREGLAAALFLKEQFSMPYVYGKPYGVSQTFQWVNTISEIISCKPKTEFTKEMDGAKRQIDEVKSFTKNKTAAIGGSYDTVKGLQEMLQTEFGMKTIAWLDTVTNDNGNLPFFNEEQRFAAGQNADLLLADGFTIEGISEKKELSTYQISNPGPHISPFQSPLCGFNGIGTIIRFLCSNTKEELL